MTGQGRGAKMREEVPMPQVATVTKDHDVHLPAELRRAIGWKPGQKLAVLQKPHGVTLVPVPELEDLRGIAKGADPSTVRERGARSR